MHEVLDVDLLLVHGESLLTPEARTFFSHYSLNSRRSKIKKFGKHKVFDLNSMVFLKFPHENLIILFLNSRISCLNSRFRKINLQLLAEKRLKRALP